MKASPLDEFIARSHARGQCDKHGVATGFPVPWAFTLATPGPTPDSHPSCRNIGIHHVDAEGFVFACRGHPGGAAGGGSLASICFLAGNYPNAGFEEQWRAEGIVQPLDVSEATPLNADQDLQVQIVASAAFSEARRAKSGSSDPVDTNGRLLLPTDEDAATLDARVAAVETRRAAGKLHADEIKRAGFRWYRLAPSRVEVLAGGPSWPHGPTRHEWIKSAHAGVWTPPTRVLPYNVADVEGPTGNAANKSFNVEARVDVKRDGGWDSPASARGGFGWTWFEMMLAAYALGVTAACVLLLRMSGGM